MIDILLEDTKTATTLDQLKEMQRLFKAYGQDEPKLLTIVNEDCAARGITKVYFKILTSKNGYIGNVRELHLLNCGLRI